MGNDVIPENDITTENSVLVPVGINIPTSVKDKPDIANDIQNVVPNRPTPPAPVTAPAQIPQLDPTNDDSVANNNTTDSTNSQMTSSDTVPASKEKKGTLVTKSFALLRRV